MAERRAAAVLALVVALLALGGVAGTLSTGSLPLGEPEPDPTVTDGIVQPPDNETLDPAERSKEGSWNVPVPPMAVLIAFALALGAASVLLLVRTGGFGGGDDDVPVDDDTDLEAVAASAGDAADRIETGADVSNEVYRAWREMTAHLDVSDPKTTTPGEFADAATAAGMDEAAVAELTALFEEVRYGEMSPEGREERAVAALRRIESAHGDGGGSE